MNQGWAMAQQVEAHRRDLATMAEARRVRVLSVARQTLRTDAPGSEADPSTRRSATGLPIPGDRAARRLHPVGERLGGWLIQAGTRLGGASIRTS
jgi:hypothetical protein